MHYQLQYLHIYAHKKSIETLKWFRSLKALLSLPGRFLCATHLLRGISESLPLEKLFFQPWSPPPPHTKHGRKLPTLTNTFQVEICAASVCLSFWRALLLESPADQTAVSQISPPHLYPPKSSQMQLPKGLILQGGGMEEGYSYSPSMSILRSQHSQWSYRCYFF